MSNMKYGAHYIKFLLSLMSTFNLNLKLLRNENVGNKLGFRLFR